MEWIPPCKGETHAVKFQAQVLGQKNPTHLFRPYRACHCFTAHTQGDALGFHRTPRWGWEGVVRLTASPRWGWEGVVRSRRLPVGAGKAGFVHGVCLVGAGKAWFVTRRLPVGLEARHTDGPFSKFTRRAMT